MQDVRVNRFYKTQRKIMVEEGIIEELQNSCKKYFSNVTSAKETPRVLSRPGTSIKEKPKEKHSAKLSRKKKETEKKHLERVHLDSAKERGG